MKKLLVNAPNGLQEIVEIQDTGSYFDPSLVIWDERTDGPLPEITIGGMVRSQGALKFSAQKAAQTAAVIAEESQRAEAKPVTAESIAAALIAKGIITEADLK